MLKIYVNENESVKYVMYLYVVLFILVIVKIILIIVLKNNDRVFKENFIVCKVIFMCFNKSMVWNM